ncbi:MAG TPA: protease modulator HflC [Deltaproteobacteria bacterium]|nr:protease modulator HflC [Deltaproteobacteria bacterium]
MRIASAGILAVLLLAAFVGANAIYAVYENEQVIITQFGKPVGDAISDPGLHVKTPFVQKVNRFEKRFLEWDGDPNQVPTRDKRFIWVDTMARWRISDPLLFFQRLRDEAGAQSRLDDILDGETRNTIAKHNLIEIVRSSNAKLEDSSPESGATDSGASPAPAEQGEPVADADAPTPEGLEPPSGDGTEDAETPPFDGSDELSGFVVGRSALAREVLESSSEAVRDLGIEILDVRFKRINYQEEVRREVYTRMISERKRIAEQYRSEGQGEAASITGDKERELKVITSEAYRTAVEIKGQADAKAADIYADAYNRSPEFYAFVKSMELYPETLGKDTELVLSTEGDFLRYVSNDR